MQLPATNRNYLQLLATGRRECTEGLERSKAGLASKLAAAQQEAGHLKAELAAESSQAHKLRAQLQTISDAHSKVRVICLILFGRRLEYLGRLAHNSK